MLYFCDGLRVARVLTDAAAGSPAFMAATAQLYSVRRETFVDRVGITDEIVYTGDWQPCTEAEAFDLIEARRKRVVELI